MDARTETEREPCGLATNSGLIAERVSESVANSYFWLSILCCMYVVKTLLTSVLGATVLSDVQR